MTRYDAVNYISHGIAKRAGMSESRPVRGVDDDAATVESREDSNKKKADALDAYCVNLNDKAQQGQDRPADRPRQRDRAHDPDPLPPAEEQSALRRRPRRRQDGDRRGPRQAHRRGRCSRRARRLDHLLARHGHAARRNPLSRRFRGAAEAGRQGDRGISGLDPVHRRDPHRDRRRRHLWRRDGCLQPAEAGARLGGAIRCIGSTTYKEYRQFFEKDRALVRRFQKIDVNEPTIPDAIEILKGLKPYFEDFHRVRYTNDAIKSAVELSARYIHDRKLPDKAIDVIDETGASQMLVPEGKRKKTIGVKEIEDTDRHHGADPAEDGVEERRRGAEEPGDDAEARRLRPGQRDRAGHLGDQAGARRPARTGEADRLLSVRRARPASARRKSPSSWRRASASS